MTEKTEDPRIIFKERYSDEVIRHKVWHPMKCRTLDFLWFDQICPEGLSVAAFYSIMFAFINFARVTPIMVLYLLYKVSWKDIQQENLFSTVPFLLLGWELLIVIVLILFAMFLMLGHITRNRFLAMFHPWGLMILYYDWIFWLSVSACIHLSISDHKTHKSVPPHVDVFFCIIYCEISIYAVVYYTFATVMIIGEISIIERFF